ncbi:MAG TPA: hypothetical protein VE912_04560 [Bacteroidales bacterium]|nr:hypothetical protein [Bacteroidales bacterium]
MGKTKTVNYNKSGIENIPNNKPVTYKIKTNGGKTNYTGSAKKGRVQERLREHLKDGNIPGTKIQIEQHSSIRDAQEKENRMIKRSKPKYNNKGK